MMSHQRALGPLEYLIVRCERDGFLAGVLPALAALEHQGVMRIGAIYFIHNDAAGNPSIEMSRDPNRASGGNDADVYDLQDLMEMDDFDEIATALPPGATAALVILEHAWSVRLWQRIADTRGEVIGSGMISAASAAEMLAARDAGRYSARER